MPTVVADLTFQNLPPVINFSAYSNLRSFVALGVTKISDSTFRHCANLERVELPAMRVIYGRAAFADCRSLKTVIIPSVEIIDEWAFQNDTALETIEVGQQLSSVGGDAFKGANPDFDFIVSGPTNWNPATRQLSRVDGDEVTLLAWLREDRSPANIPANITKIGDNLFYGMTNITTLDLPAAITEIGDMAFAGCSSLAQASLPGVTRIGDSAFFETALVEVDFPEVTYVGPLAFALCLELESVKLPKVVEIGERAFQNGLIYNVPGSYDALPDVMGKLASVDLGDSLETIGHWAFIFCVKLESLTLPATVTYIERQAFASDCKIKTLTVNAVTPPVVEPHSAYSKLFGGISHLTGEIFPYALEAIYVPAESVDAYKNAPEWSFYAKHIKPIE
jgi:hypothetical protein